MILKRMVARAPSDLDDLTALLHDAYGDQDLLAFDQDSGLLEFPVAQEVDTWMDVPREVPRTRGSKRRYLPFSTLRIPFLQVNFRVRGTRSVELGPDNVEDPWMLNRIEYDPTAGWVRFVPVIGPELGAEVDELFIEAEVTAHVAITVRRRVWPLGAESDAPEGEARFVWPIADGT